VSTHLENLQREGYLWRLERRPDAAWSCGFIYALCAPREIHKAANGRKPPWEVDADWKPAPSIQSAEGDSAPDNADSAETGSAPVLKEVQHQGVIVDKSALNGSSAEAGAGGAERDDMGGAERRDIGVLKEVQRSLKSKSIQRVSHIVSAGADSRVSDPPDEIQRRIRKAITMAPEADDRAIARMVQGATLESVRQVRQAAA
jgi:hypothetical protein